MILERPIVSKENDIFERVGFAKHISEILILKCRSPSLVLALEGNWGSGKTSTINLIEQNIKDVHPEAIIIHFNPWLIGSRDSVIEGFLIQFASSLNQKLNTDVASETAAKLLNFAKFLSPIKLIPGVEPWGTLVEKTLETVGNSAKAAVDMSNLDLSKRKTLAQDSITNIGKPIVVIIDDIDRLPPDEIKIIIQVVKAIADFDGVSYLLAFEPSPILKALSYNDIYDGKRYLEKIIQVSYPIPRIGYWHLKGFLVKHIDDMLKRIDYKLDEYEKKLLNEALDTTAIVRSLSTPRDVIRLVNRLMVTSKNVKNEVSFTDTLAFETLELKYSKVSSLIRKNPEIFLSALIEGDYITQDSFDETLEKDEQKNGKTEIIEILTGYETIEQKNIRSILGLIFPKTFQKFMPYSEEENVARNRISTKEALLKLLQSGPSKYNYSSYEINHFFADSSDRREILTDMSNAGAISGWLNYAKQIIPKADINDPLSIVEELLRLSDEAFHAKKYNLTDDVGQFIIDILYNITDEESKINILDLISRSKLAISTTEHVLLRLLSKIKMWEQGEYKKMEGNEKIDNNPFTPNQLLGAKDKWLANIRDLSKTYSFIENEPEPISIFFRWAQLNDNNFDEVKDYSEKFINDHDELVKFINCFPMGKGLTGIENLLKDNNHAIEEIKKISNPSYSVKRILKYLESGDNED